MTVQGVHRVHVYSPIQGSRKAGVAGTELQRIMVVLVQDPERQDASASWKDDTAAGVRTYPGKGQSSERSTVWRTDRGYLVTSVLCLSSGLEWERRTVSYKTFVKTNLKW